MKLGTFQSAREIALEHEVAELKLQLAQMKAYGRAAPVSEFVHEEHEISSRLPHQLLLPLLATFKVEHTASNHTCPLGYRVLVTARDPRQPRNFTMGLFVSDQQLYEAQDIINLCSVLFERGMVTFVDALRKEMDDAKAG